MLGYFIKLTIIIALVLRGKHNQKKIIVSHTNI